MRDIPEALQISILICIRALLMMPINHYQQWTEWRQPSSNQRQHPQQWSNWTGHFSGDKRYHNRNSYQDIPSLRPVDIHDVVCVGNEHVAILGMNLLELYKVQIDLDRKTVFIQDKLVRTCYVSSK